MMDKTICYNCAVQIEFCASDELSMKPCPSCNEVLKIPKVHGEYILEDKLSSNQFYDTYKGCRSVSDEILVIKILKSSYELSGLQLKELDDRLNKLPKHGRLQLLKTGNSISAFRPFVETSVNDYLEKSRPQQDKAIYILTEIAKILNDCSKEEIFPVDIMIGNILMDNNGKVIISDLLFRETVNEFCSVDNKDSILNTHCTTIKYLNQKEKDVRDSLFAFGCLSYYLCCGTFPWPKGSYEVVQKARNIQPEVLLKLRGESPEFLKSFIKGLIDENSLKVQSFQNALEVLNEKMLPSPVKARKKAPAAEKKKLSKIPNKARVKSKKNRQKSNPIPLIAGLILVVIISVIIIVSTNSKPIIPLAKAEEKTKIEEKPKIIKKVKATNTPIQRKEAEMSLKAKKSTPPAVKEIQAPIVKEVPKKDRAAVKAELLPPDLNFDPLISKLDEYIEATEFKDRELEEDKIGYVSTYRDHLLIHFYRKPYTGVFYLHKQAPFRGKIIKADELNIHLLDLKSKKPLIISWKDFEFNQFHEFADYYAAAESEVFSLSENNEEVFKKAAEEYSKLAVVLDWYGFKNEAVNYKKKSIKFNPGLAQELDTLIKEVPTN